MSNSAHSAQKWMMAVTIVATLFSFVAALAAWRSATTAEKLLDRQIASDKPQFLHGWLNVRTHATPTAHNIDYKIELLNLGRIAAESVRIRSFTATDHIRSTVKGQLLELAHPVLSNQKVFFSGSATTKPEEQFWVAFYVEYTDSTVPESDRLLQKLCFRAIRPTELKNRDPAEWDSFPCTVGEARTMWSTVESEHDRLF